MSLVDFYGADASDLLNKKLFLLDMDGTIYLGDEIFEGTLEFLDTIKKNGGRYVFVTNNSSKSVEDYLKKVHGMGIEATKENFFTSSQAAVLMLKEKYAGKLVYCQGTESLLFELRENGIRISTEYRDDYDVVLVGFDTEITGKKLETTSKVLTLNKDIPYYATNPDLVCPVSFGYIPDCGSMCIGLKNATGRYPVFIGKPEPTMIEIAMKKFNASKEETLVIGDRIYTDVKSGLNAGVTGVCVLSGEVTKEDVEKSDVKPTFTFLSIREINEVLKQKR